MGCALGCLRLLFLALWRAILAAMLAVLLARIDAYIDEHHGESLPGRAWRAYRRRGRKAVRRGTPPDAPSAIDTRGKARPLHRAPADRDLRHGRRALPRRGPPSVR